MGLVVRDEAAVFRFNPDDAVHRQAGVSAKESGFTRSKTRRAGGSEGNGG